MLEGNLISVIIPTTIYDKFLREAVESVFRDGWNHLEVVVVMDGIEQPAPQWLQAPNIVLTATGHRSGSAAAINLGIASSHGDYIARLDADDLSRPGRFAKQIEFLRDHADVILVGGDAEIIDRDGNRLGPYDSRPGPDLRLTLLRRNPFVHSSFFMRREDLDTCGLYDESCTRMQDYELVLRLAVKGKLAIINEPMVGYRIHGSQNSNRISGFFPLMTKLSHRKRDLARHLGRSVVVQILFDVLYSSAQYARYQGWRKPRYLNGVQ